jgi:protein SCO1/2
MKTKVLTILLFATVLLAAGALAAETPKKDACCCEGKGAAATGVKKDACCAVMESAAFSKNSLYQLDATFTDDSGKAFSLGSLRGRPVVVNMFFASCGYACPLTVTDLLAIEGRVPAGLREQPVFVLVSFDTARDTAEVLAKYRAQRGLGSQWILLRGDNDAVRELAALLGVKYKQEADGSFSHSNLVTILNREGEIVHQRTGLQGGLDEAAAALTTVAQAK